jgi:hypothetical protein
MKNTSNNTETTLLLQSFALIGLSTLFGGVFVTVALCHAVYRGNEWMARA